MDQNSAFDESLKQEVQKALLEKIITAFEQQDISMVQMKDSASFILDMIPTIKDYSQFVAFLDSLQAKWPIFKDVHNLYKLRFYKESEKAVMDKLSSYISNFQH